MEVLNIPILTLFASYNAPDSVKVWALTREENRSNFDLTTEQLDHRLDEACSLYQLAIKKYTTK